MVTEEEHNSQEQKAILDLADRLVGRWLGQGETFSAGLARHARDEAGRVRAMPEDEARHELDQLLGLTLQGSKAADIRRQERRRQSASARALAALSLAVVVGRNS
jgi:hypothetical protein